MKPKFTPVGVPWTASESGAAINGVMRAKTDAGNTYTYEVVLARTVTPFFNHRSAKERRDIARLMAAAPELFEAVEIIAAKANDLHALGLITTDEHGVILAAIAKATAPTTAAMAEPQGAGGDSE